MLCSTPQCAVSLGILIIQCASADHDYFAFLFNDLIVLYEYVGFFYGRLTN